MVEGLLVRPGARACIVARFMPAGATLHIETNDSGEETEADLGKVQLLALLEG